MGLPNLALIANEWAAARAIAHVRGRVHLGAGNQDTNPQQGKAFRRQLEARMDIAIISETSNGAEVPTTKRVAATAIASGAANCAQQCSIALLFLERLDCLPVDLMSDPYNDHSFLVLGRPADTDDRFDDEWGPNAVVCDPWSNISGPVTAPAIREMLDQYSSYRLQFRVERKAHLAKYAKESPLP